MKTVKTAWRVHPLSYIHTECIEHHCCQLQLLRWSWTLLQSPPYTAASKSHALNNILSLNLPYRIARDFEAYLVFGRSRLVIFPRSTLSMWIWLVWTWVTQQFKVQNLLSSLVIATNCSAYGYWIILKIKGLKWLPQPAKICKNCVEDCVTTRAIENISTVQLFYCCN